MCKHRDPLKSFTGTICRTCILESTRRVFAELAEELRAEMNSGKYNGIDTIERTQ